jgi:hypothetical protein
MILEASLMVRDSNERRRNLRVGMRIRIGNPRLYHFPPDAAASSSSSSQALKHDDVVIVPEFFGPSEDWSLHYTLVREITELQRRQVPGSEWISWHEGSHLIVKTPELIAHLSKHHPKIVSILSN